MDSKDNSPERIKEIAKSLRQPTPEELKQDEELIDRMLKAANEYMAAKGWNNEGFMPHAETVMRVIHYDSSHGSGVPVLQTKQGRLLVAGIKLIDVCTKSGVYKFGDIVSKISQKGIIISDDFLIALKRVYGSYLMKHDNPELDDLETVISFQLPRSEKIIYLRKG